MPLDDYRIESFSHGGYTHDVYHRGEGRCVLVGKDHGDPVPERTAGGPDGRFAIVPLDLEVELRMHQGEPREPVGDVAPLGPGTLQELASRGCVKKQITHLYCGARIVGQRRVLNQSAAVYFTHSPH